MAVDDAGAGYAGLQQIMRMKADIIKLDRALVSDVHVDSGQERARSARWSGSRARPAPSVCAEGIETLDVLRVLIRLGVGYGQGFGLARPAAPWTLVDHEAAGLCRALAREESGARPHHLPAVPSRRRSHTG